MPGLPRKGTTRVNRHGHYKISREYTEPVERAAPAQIPPKAKDDHRHEQDPRWELVQRVAGSLAFQKSRRLREFLLFVCERAVRDPDSVVREQDIGVLVFGRSTDFDPSEDTLVRVQASQLRKRLQQYFIGEGAAEPVIIEIPKGTYMPAFREREAVVAEVKPEDAAPPPTPRLDLRLPLGLLSLVLAIACAWLFVQYRELRGRLNEGREPRPSVDRLWKQMFGNRHTYVVLSDGTLTMFEDLLHKQLSPTEYQRQQFPKLAEAQLKDPTVLDFSRRLMNRQFTPIADVALAQRISRLGAAQGTPIEVLFARSAATQHFKAHNAVLSGSRRGNPWIELFEARLNFRSRFDEDARMSYIDNVAPQPGEAGVYEVKWDRVGYCRVAYLPNLDATGSVLLVSGTDFSSTDAGAEFITSERWVKPLLAALQAGDGGRPIPYFEVLLRAQLVLGAAPSFEMIAHRTVKPS